MIRELDTVALTVDLPRYGLKSGDIGAVVLMHDQKGCEVEFITLGGETVAVVSLHLEQIREISKREIASARLVA